LVLFKYYWHLTKIEIGVRYGCVADNGMYL